MNLARLSYVAFAMWVLLTFSTCKEKELPFDDSMTSKLVKASVAGRVYYDEQTPAPYAQVRLADGSTTKADINGYFFFHDVTLKAPYSYLKVETNEAFPASRTFWVQEKSVNYVRIKLIPKTISGYINAAEGGTVEFDGASVTLPPNSVMYANGGLYTGNIMVLGHYLSPNAPDLHEIMPGELLGYDEHNTRHFLQTFGMIAVELLDADGNPLQVAGGKKATIALPAVPNLSHEGEMPLWYFDTKIGYWKREGAATLQNGKWVGEVSHFSFWNCDVPTLQGTIKFRLVNNNGTPIPNVIAELASPTYGTGVGITNSNGEVQGIVPANQTLTLTAYGLSCGTWNYPTTIQTTTGNTDLGDIVIPTYTQETHLTGQILNCNGNPASITNGIIVIKHYDNHFEYFPINSANFDVQLAYCNTAPQVSIKINDYTTLLGSNYLDTTLVNGTIDLGDITICGNNVGSNDEYFDYQIDNNSYHVTQNGLTCNITNNSGLPMIDMAILIDNGVMYGQLYMYHNLLNNMYYVNAGCNLPNTATDSLYNTPVNITHFPQGTGDYLDGNFTTTYTDSTGTHNVQCAFHVIRDN